jgi:hypothetical protein
MKSVLIQIFQGPLTCARVLLRTLKQDSTFLNETWSPLWFNAHYLQTTTGGITHSSCSKLKHHWTALIYFQHVQTNECDLQVPVPATSHFLQSKSHVLQNFIHYPRVEAGRNTSTVIPASRKRRRKGNPVVSDETVMCGYEFSATLTTDRLHYKLQTRPLFREGAPRRRPKQFSDKTKEKETPGHGPQRCARHQDGRADWPQLDSFMKHCHQLPACPVTG